MKKVLFVATVVKTHIVAFHIPFLEWFKKHGYEVHVCAKNDYSNKDECIIPFCDKYFNLEFERSPFNFKNVEVFFKLRELISNNNYDLIHCHTPVGGVLTRLASKKSRKKGTKVIYTAHGFHFYKGAPMKNWILYYPVEKILARLTDTIITINKEDYTVAKHFNKSKIEYVPGVGINLSKFQDKIVDKEQVVTKLGVDKNKIILLSVGELIKRKNHQIVIKALSKLNNKNIIYLICGQGELEVNLKKLANDLNVNVKFLGYRNDVEQICSISDVFVFPSTQEGLPIALIEAMASGMPVVCSNIRGNNELIENGCGGYLVKTNSVDEYVKYIDMLVKDEELRDRMGMINVNSARKYNSEIVKYNMAEIYTKLIV